MKTLSAGVRLSRLFIKQVPPLRYNVDASTIRTHDGFNSDYIFGLPVFFGEAVLALPPNSVNDYRIQHFIDARFAMNAGIRVLCGDNKKPPIKKGESPALVLARIVY